MEIPTRLTRAAIVLLAPILVAGLVACARRETAQNVPPPSDTPVAAPTDTGAAPASPEDTWSDASVLQAMIDANTAEIRNAELATTRSSNAAVKTYASQIITDHTALTQRVRQLATRLGMTPTSGPASAQMASDAGSARDALRGAAVTDFDVAYAEHEVAAHQAILDLVDRTLIPTAQQVDLHALLENARPGFAAHLEHARHLQAALVR